MHERTVIGLANIRTRKPGMQDVASRPGSRDSRSH